MPDDITISIDGVEVPTQPGKMVLEAAIDAGIYLPYLCYHPGMKPYAACRMCVIEVEGQRGYPAACTLPAADGMVVRNQSPEVDRLRRSVMEMLIAEHPNGCLTCHRIDICGPNDVCLRHVSVNDRCVTCPKNERCELKDTVRYLGMSLESPLGYKYRNIPLEVSDPFYDRDYNLCIVCGRCVRACEELRGDDAIGFTERSGQALVGTSFGTSLLESGCEFCGSCIDVCPVGALVERNHKWEKARRVERTICPHCPVGCQLNLEFNAQDTLIRAIPELNSPANRGQACFKGKFGLEFVNDHSRLTTPLIRRDGTLQPASWDEALDFVAARLSQTRGPEFALLTSPNSTNEEHYLAQKFARVVMESNNVDHTSNTAPELVLGLEQSLGYAAATNPIWELEQAGAILVFNANVTEEQNVAAVPIKRAARKQAQLIVIDSREVELTRYARLWLRPAPGAELLLLGGLLRSVLDQGLADEAWLAENCESPATLNYALRSLDLDEVAAQTGVSAADIAAAARLYAQANAGAIVYGLDNTPSGHQRHCVLSLVNLALLTGNLGQPGAGLYPMRRGANEQGAWDVGCLPNRLPGYGQISAPADRAAAAALWGAPPPETPGLGLTQMPDAARQGRLKAALVIGDSPHFRPGQPDDALESLAGLDFLAVHDTFLTPLAQRADVVLPRATFVEKSGTYTNLERRIQLLKPGLRKPAADSPESANDGAQPESWLITRLAERLKPGAFPELTPAETMDEIAQAAPAIYGGVSHRRLEREGALLLRTQLESPQPTQALYAGRQHRGLQWPCPPPDATGKPHPGTPSLYAGGFAGRKVEPLTPAFNLPVPPPTAEHPLWFAPGRVLLQQHREMEIVKGKRNRIRREEWLELHPYDVANHGLAEGDHAAIMFQSPNGNPTNPETPLPGVIRLNPQLPPGVAAATALFGQLAIDMQASEEHDPAAMLPGLDVRPARLVKTEPPE